MSGLIPFFPDPMDLFGLVGSNPLDPLNPLSGQNDSGGGTLPLVALGLAGAAIAFVLLDDE